MAKDLPELPDLPARDARCVWHPYTQHATDRDPLPVVGASGAELELADGRRLIDGISSWWACLHGHGEPSLVQEAARQAAKLDHVLFAGATHEPAVALAEELVALAPPGLTRVFFSDDGSTAVEVAMKMAYHRWIHAGATQRRVFVALEGAYHGDTFGAMAVGDRDPFFRAYEPLLFQVRHVPPDAGALARALDELADRAAALILEPLLQGAAGMQMYPAATLRALAETAARAGVPVIADEVLTGFGRTGSLFACEQAGITPDYMCMAKGLTNGMFPLSVTLSREDTFAAFLSADRARFFPHGHTMTANPIGCAIARASLALCRERDTPARLGRIGAHLLSHLNDISRHPAVTNLRHLGGVVAFDVRPPAGDRPGYMAALAPRLRAVALDHGVLLRPLGNVVYAMPPACTTEAQVERIATTMRAMADASLT